MVTIQVKNIEGKTTLPIRGSEVSAGYDIVAIDDPIIAGEIAYVKEKITYYKNIDYIEYHTALYISPPKQGIIHPSPSIHTLIHPRSSVRKYNLLLANSIGLIDNDYRGEIIVCYKYIFQPEDLSLTFQRVSVSDGGSDHYISEPTGELVGVINPNKVYKKGDRIAQLVMENTIDATFKLVSELDATERGEGGFGSTTDKKENIKFFNLPGNSYVNGTRADILAEKYNTQVKDKIQTKRPYSEEVKERTQT